MTLDCLAYRPCGLTGGGCCDAGRFGGSVSHGVCVGVCQDRRPGRTHDIALPTEPTPAPRDARTGPERWRELHDRADRPVAVPAAELAWIERLADGLEGCGCSRHWRQYLQQHPPDVTTPGAYVRWAGAAHDAVNERLGKVLRITHQ